MFDLRKRPQFVYRLSAVREDRGSAFKGKRVKR
nr:MAG TPA: hypothetical protein [Caudoviricetes sp.]